MAYRRDADRRKRVLAHMGERVVHYGEIAKLLGIRPDAANQLLRAMTDEKLLGKVSIGRWKATGRKPVIERANARTDWPVAPELARVW